MKWKQHMSMFNKEPVYFAPQLVDPETQYSDSELL